MHFCKIKIVTSQSVCGGGGGGYRTMSREGGKGSKRCHVLYEWPLTNNEREIKIIIHQHFFFFALTTMADASILVRSDRK